MRSGKFLAQSVCRKKPVPVANREEVQRTIISDIIIEQNAVTFNAHLPGRKSTDVRIQITNPPQSPVVTVPCNFLLNPQ
jgi:hypothetical protein